MPYQVSRHGGLEKVETGPAEDAPEGRPNLADVNLLERAVRASWDVPGEAAAVVPADLLETFRRTKSIRARVALARTMDAMLRTNLASVSAVLDVQERSELEVRLKALEAERAASDVTQ